MVRSVLDLLVMNAVLASLLAVIVHVLGRWIRNPSLLRALWIVVLLKFVTPSFCPFPIWLPVLPSPQATDRGLLAEGLPIEKAAGHIPCKKCRPSREAKDRDVVAWAVENETRPASPVFAITDQHEHLFSTAPSRGMTKRESGPGGAARPLDPSRSDSARFSRRTAWFAMFYENRDFWSLCLILPILLGAVICLCRQWASWRRFQVILKVGQTAPHAVLTLTAKLARRLGLRCVPDVWVVPCRMSPLLYAPSIRPRIILPRDLVENLEPEALQSLLAHELTHYQRGDYWARLLETAVTVLYWWHPVTWWARREVERHEELCCDAAVIQLLECDGRTYADALLDTMDFLSHDDQRTPAFCRGVGHLSILRERIIHIMQGGCPIQTSAKNRWGVLILATVWLPLKPVVILAPPGQFQQHAILIQTANEKPRDSQDTESEESIELPSLPSVGKPALNSFFRHIFGMERSPPQFFGRWGEQSNLYAERLEQLQDMILVPAWILASEVEDSSVFPLEGDTLPGPSMSKKEGSPGELPPLVAYLTATGASLIFRPVETVSGAIAAWMILG